MKHSIYTSYYELPLMLSVTEVAAVLGISRAGAYELVHGNEVPALKIGSRIVVPKDKFLAWIDACLLYTSQKGVSLRETDECLHAVGSTLGADNGIGMALILSLIHI